MKGRLLTSFLFAAVILAAASTATASTIWYVNGVSGRDSNTCTSTTTACKTIGHAISLASSGDTIMVAATTYTENLTIGFSLKIVGSGATTTIIDGGGVKFGTVVTISNTNAHVALSKLTMQHGKGGGIGNAGTLTISHSTISNNTKFLAGGGIVNGGTLTINRCFIFNNAARGFCFPKCVSSSGGGIANGGTLTINNSTLRGNGAGYGGGIDNSANLAINNSTFSGNSAANFGGGIYSYGTLTISNSTISGSSANSGGGIYNQSGSTVALQNSIVANNLSGGNCHGSMTSNGYNLSSDDTCNFNNTGDLNNIDPKLGQLGNYGGPTQTIPLLSGSPAIDAGNPSGCTDGHGHLLTTDQRGKPRPDKEDSGGCDMGAYERQSD